MQAEIINTFKACYDMDDKLLTLNRKDGGRGDKKWRKSDMVDSDFEEDSPIFAKQNQRSCSQGEEVNIARQTDPSDTSWDPELQILSVKSLKKAGRPKMAMLSLPIFGHDLTDGLTDVNFCRADDPANPILILRSVELGSINFRDDYTHTFKLAEGKEQVKRAVNSVNLCALNSYKQTSVLHPNHALEKVSKQNQHDLYVHPKYQHLLSLDIFTQLNNEEKVTANPKVRSATKAIEGVRLVIDEGLTIERASDKVGLSYTALWREIAAYKIDPVRYCQMKSELFSTPEDKLLPDSEVVKEKLCLEKPLLPTLGHFVNFMRGHFVLPENMPNSKLISESKKKYKIAKRAPKISKLVKESEDRTLGAQAFRSIVTNFFADHDFISIFDVTSFRLDKSSVKFWTMPKVKPEMQVQQGTVSVHVLCAVSSAGVDMLMLKKGSVFAEDINVFFLTYFENYARRRVVLLDNAGVHRRRDLEMIGRVADRKFCYNVPHNPHDNPVEWMFGAVKAKYRARTATKVYFNIKDVIESFRDVHTMCYTSTIQKCMRYAYRYDPAN